MQNMVDPLRLPGMGIVAADDDLDLAASAE
jgi:hypothetical protein